MIHLWSIVYSPPSERTTWASSKTFSAAPARTESRYYTFSVKCGRCDELIQVRVDLNYDLSLNDEGNGFLVRKTLIGSDRNFQQIEVELNFDSGRQLLEKTITGGEFVSL